MKVDAQEFSPTRLTEAREELGLSKTDLARKVGVSVASISQYESGVTRPSMLTVGKLIDALSKNIQFFYTLPNRNYSIVSPVSFRKFTSTSVKQRKIANIKMQYANDILNRIFQDINPQVMNITIDYSVKDETELLDLDEGEIEFIADQTRNTFGLDNRSVDNLSILLENQGVVIFNLELPSGIDAFSYWAVYEDTGVERPIIITNKKNNYYRQRFDLAHELGHLVMHRLLEEDVIIKNIQTVEKQAHRFASAFLMPNREFLESIYDYSFSGLIPLKQLWGVSMAAIMRRMFDLGIIDEGKYKNWNIELSRKGMRRNEPGDTKKTREEASFVKSAITFIVNNKLSGVDDFEQELGLSFRELAYYTNNELFLNRLDSRNVIKFKAKSFK